MLIRRALAAVVVPCTLMLGAMAFAPNDAQAFCGFYVGGAGTKLFNDATQVVMMREGTRTVLSMQNDYKGPPEKFAMVVPVPVVLQKPDVKTLPRDVFSRVDLLDAPRLVEYWEQDPCMHERPQTAAVEEASPAPPSAPQPAKAAGALGVKIEAQFTVGEYEIVILSAKDSTGLDTWLKQEKYAIPEGSEPYLKPYVAAGSKFFVARVDPTKVTFENGRAALSPLRFHYDTDTFTLPVRLGLVNSSGTQDLIVHILAKQRYELANYPNTTIPTNFDVGEAARAEFGSFYAALFDRTVEKHPKAVVTEYAWGASSCDPCPGGSYGLSQADIMTLGADVLPSNVVKPPPVPPVPTGFKMLGPGPAQQPGSPSPPPQPPQPSKVAAPSMGARVFTPMPGFILTRLHARYSKEALGQDLVFKTASAISGGREVRGADGTLEHGSKPDSVDNFQGRYAIRHPWIGPMTCKEPRRGIWGGPPDGRGGVPAAPATKTAFVPRDKVKIEAVVMKDIPEIDVKASGAAAVAGFQPPPTPTTTTTTGNNTKPMTTPVGDAGDGASVGKTGCAGCTSTSRSPSGEALGAVLAAAIAFVIRSRSRKRPR